MSFLKVENYRKSFGNTEVLKGVSFELEKGQVLAIIGSSGGGKTTLLRCINFLEIPDSGRLYLNDELLFDASEIKNDNYSDNDLRMKRLHFGLVFQQFNLFPQYNVLGNVLLARRLLDKQTVKRKREELIASGVPKSEVSDMMKVFEAELEKRTNAEAVALIARVGLSDKINSYPCELSGGQCQRVAIARALALTPDVLCFDEPTSALDPELTGEVLKVIRGLKSGDRTMIVVTHEMEFARKVADKVIFIADGVIEEEGTPEEVFDFPKSEKMKNFLRSKENKEGLYGEQPSCETAE